MTIEDFIMARLAETRRAITGLPRPLWATINSLLTNQEQVVLMHRRWPVLVESPPDYEHDATGVDPNYWTFRVTQQINWLTQEEYRKKFGSEPPTAPLIREMCLIWQHHPDFDPAWIGEKTDG